MKDFLENDFLLTTKTAKKLYHDYAAKQPIFDFHCHLSPKQIYENKKFRNITDVWLGGDHYKWRLMREMGIEEKFISGDAPDKEKFFKYAEIMPYAIGNPIYHWTHLELKRFFNIDLILSLKTAEEIWIKANKVLENLMPRQMIEMSNVRALCTTDDPCDDLQYHKLIRDDESFKVQVTPAFRPDKLINIELSWFCDYIKKFADVAEIDANSFDSLLKGIEKRVEFFDQNGCVCSDHALDVVMYEPCTKNEAAEIYNKAIKGTTLCSKEIAKYKGFMLTVFGRLYHKYNWVQQYHIGALRNVSSRYLKELGPDTGFDAVEDQPFASMLGRLLDSLDSTNQLPKTMLYCLNPADNQVLATVRNCFQSAGTVAKIQFGSAWWFNDQLDGMNAQMEMLSQTGLISKFVGMLTDSRSFLSYPRHEYFRRLLCQRIGNLIEEGLYPDEIDFVGKIIEDICYNNSKKYFTK